MSFARLSKSKPFCVLLFFFLMVVQNSAWALPQFARKYNVSCIECHAAVPRLNQTGYKFRAAGYRFPNEIGKMQTPKFENYNSARVQTQAYITQFKPRETNKTESQSQIDFVKAAIHPVTGSWGENFGTGAEFTFVKSGKVEIEQAQVRYVYGTEDSFGSIRGGVFHAFEGFSASDRPVGLSSPLIQSSQANRGATSTLLSPTDPSTAGLTAAYWLKNTNATLSLLNRPGVKVSDGEAEISYLSSFSNKMTDLLFSLTHIYDTKGAGSGITLYYYRGQSIIPTDTGTYGVTGGGTTFTNNFQKFSLSGNYFVTEELSIIAGAGNGSDKLSRSNPTLRSSGYFAGFEYYYPDSNIANGLRYDEFYNDTSHAGNKTTAATAFINWLPINQVQIVGEYQYKYKGMNVPDPINQHILTAQLMFLY